jgi:hypothetical protein
VSALEVRLSALTALTGASLPSGAAGAELAATVSHALAASDFRERRAAVLAVTAHPELWPDRATLLRPLRNDPSGFVREALR